MKLTFDIEKAKTITVRIFLNTIIEKVITLSMTFDLHLKSNTLQNVLIFCKGIRFCAQ